MHMQQPRPSSLFSEVATDREFVHQNVSASGVKIKVKIIPYKASAPATLAHTQRDREAGSSTPSRALSRDRGASSASSSPSSSSSSSSKKAVQDHPHQDPIATRVLPTAASARTSVTSSQRAQQRQSPIATSQHTSSTTAERPSLTTAKRADLAAAKRGEELCGWEDGLFGAVEMRVHGQENLNAQAFYRLGDERLDLSEEEVGLEEVYGLIGVLMPKAE